MKHVHNTTTIKEYIGKDMRNNTLVYNEKEICEECGEEVIEIR